jgi:hypothetical protein
MRVALPRAITPEDVTPEWLTDLLLRENVLPIGRVVAIEQESSAAFNSNVVYLKPTYSVLDSSSLPRRLLLKCSRNEAWAIRAGAREVAFYQISVCRIILRSSCVVMMPSILKKQASRTSCWKTFPILTSSLLSATGKSRWSTICPRIVI